MTPRPFEVTLQFPVRTYDIDFAGIVSNIVYIRWLEDLRLQVMAEFYPLEQAVKEHGISPVLLRTSIEYKRPLRLFDEPTGRMWMTGAGRARFGLAAEFLTDGRVVAVAEQEGCFIDLVTTRPVRTPKMIRERFPISDISPNT